MKFQLIWTSSFWVMANFPWMFGHFEDFFFLPLFLLFFPHIWSYLWNYLSNWTEISCGSRFWPLGAAHQISAFLRLKDAEDIGWFVWHAKWFCDVRVPVQRIQPFWIGDVWNVFSKISEIKLRCNRASHLSCERVYTTLSQLDCEWGLTVRRQSLKLIKTTLLQCILCAGLFA